MRCSLITWLGPILWVFTSTSLFADEWPEEWFQPPAEKSSDVIPLRSVFELSTDELEKLKQKPYVQKWAQRLAKVKSVSSFNERVIEFEMRPPHDVEAEVVGVAHLFANKVQDLMSKASPIRSAQLLGAALQLRRFLRDQYGLVDPFSLAPILSKLPDSKFKQRIALIADLLEMENNFGWRPKVDRGRGARHELYENLMIWASSSEANNIDPGRKFSLTRAELKSIYSEIRGAIRYTMGNSRIENTFIQMLFDIAESQGGAAQLAETAKRMSAIGSERSGEEIEGQLGKSLFFTGALGSVTWLGHWMATSTEQSDAWVHWLGGNTGALVKYSAGTFTAVALSASAFWLWEGLRWRWNMARIRSGRLDNKSGNQYQWLNVAKYFQEVHDFAVRRIPPEEVRAPAPGWWKRVKDACWAKIASLRSR